MHLVLQNIQHLGADLERHDYRVELGEGGETEEDVDDVGGEVDAGPPLLPAGGGVQGDLPASSHLSTLDRAPSRVSLLLSSSRLSGFLASWRIRQEPRTLPDTCREKGGGGVKRRKEEEGGRKEEGGRRKEEGERRKEKGERRKEEGGRRKEE